MTPCWLGCFLKALSIFDIMTAIVNDGTKKSTLCTCSDRLKWEFRPSYPLFSLEEPSGRMIDIRESFAPRRPCHLTPLLRLVFLLWSIQVLCDDIFYTYPRHNLWIYLGYLTHWGHCFTILFFVCSLVCSILPQSSACFQQSDNDGKAVHGFIKWTWGLYALVAPLELAITLLYWGSGIAGRTTYSRYARRL